MADYAIRIQCRWIWIRILIQIPIHISVWTQSRSAQVGEHLFVQIMIWISSYSISRVQAKGPVGLGGLPWILLNGPKMCAILNSEIRSHNLSDSQFFLHVCGASCTNLDEPDCSFFITISLFLSSLELHPWQHHWPQLVNSWTKKKETS